MTTQVQLQFLNICKYLTTRTTAMPKLIYVAHKSSAFLLQVQIRTMFIEQAILIHNQHLGV